MLASELEGNTIPVKLHLGSFLLPPKQVAMVKSGFASLSLVLCQKTRKLSLHVLIAYNKNLSSW